MKVSVIMSDSEVMIVTADYVKTACKNAETPSAHLTHAPFFLLKRRLSRSLRVIYLIPRCQPNEGRNDAF